MQARLIYRNKKRLASGAIVEEVVWKLTHPVPDRPHGYKYRLAYVREGKRIIGYATSAAKAITAIGGVVKNVTNLYRSSGCSPTSERMWCMRRASHEASSDGKSGKS